MGGRQAPWRLMGVAAAALAVVSVPGVLLAFPAASTIQLSDTIRPAFTPSGVDRRLAALAGRYLPAASTGKQAGDSFRFTPAGVDRSGSRALTVAVRSRGNNAIAFKRALDPTRLGLGEGAPVTIRPSSYSLGSARGLQNFTLPVPRREARAPALADLGSGGFSIDQLNGKTDKPSRFASRVTVQREPTKDVSATPLATDVNFDLGGSFSVTRSVAVTAGVRYERDTDSAQRLTDEATDQQAVYVGTLIRF